jgi:predicted acetyltransferase
MMTFLYTQFDQVRHVVYSAPDDDFHFVPADPRNQTDNMLYPGGTVFHESGKSGIGVMFRVVDVPGAFANLRDHDFGGQSCRVKLTVRDTFLPENDGSYVIDFKNGAVQSVKNSGKADFEISLDIADFSSVIMGSVDLLNLYRYGRVELSDDRYLDAAGRLFYVREKPRCTTQF